MSLQTSKKVCLIVFALLILLIICIFFNDIISEPENPKFVLEQCKSSGD